MGPLGMLSLLEIPLGLTRLAPSPAERIAQMRGCLAAARTGTRFYEKTFKVDEFGTAAALLDWRDRWYEHGWDGNVPEGSSPRLQDMAVIDLLARSAVFPSIGERLNEVAKLLGSRHTQIESIELVDPMAEFPVTWQRVLEKLPAKWSPGLGTEPVAPPGSMLRTLQAAVLSLSDTPAEKLPWRDDGTVRVLRAESTLAAAEWLAGACRAASAADRVWIVEEAGATVDAALGAMDQPLLGSSEPSAFRPTLQLLPLGLRLLWEPLDFKALLQFLTHPVGPIRRFARRTLAEKMAQYPGIGGAAWDAALKKIADRYEDEGPAVLAEIAFWLEADRFNVRDSVTLDVVQARVDRLSQWFLERMANPDPLGRASWAVAYAQTSAAARTLETLKLQGIGTLTVDTLDRIVSQATARGSENPGLNAQASSNALVGHPSAILEPFDEVCWWHLTAPALVSRYPWSPKEVQELRSIGVELPPLKQVLQHEARGWLRPVLAARRRLTLVLPSEDQEPHPIWLTLSALLEKPTIVDVETTLSEPAANSGVIPIPYRPLPQRRRWFQIPAGAIHGWEHAASFSSLDQFFNNPFQWALNYPAQLKASALLDVPNDFRLLGNLAHRIVERLYRHGDALGWSESQVVAWFDQAIEKVVREEGAVLLMSGRRADLESFRLRFRRSLAQLHRCLVAAGVQRVDPEVALVGATPLGTLRGDSDLLATFADGSRAIIDMKWAGNAKYRKKLMNQTHTQLAIYARLVENNTNNWPAVAYFILKDPELLTTATGVFPGATPIAVQGASTSLLWQRIETTWRWRRAQIEAGALELALEELEPTDSSTPPAGGLNPEELEQRYNACVNLAGWDQDA